MTEQQLGEMVLNRESETLEFKTTTGEQRPGIQTLCAFLNTRGGVVVFGVTPEGSMRGQHVGDRTIEQLSQEIAEIDPPTFPTIDVITGRNDLKFVTITVAHGQVRPYSYRGRAYRRVGNTTLELSREEYNSMLLERMHAERRWENEVANGWSVEDLDAAEILKTITESVERGRGSDPGTRDLRQILTSLGLVKNDQLLKAATVLFGKRERLEADAPQCLLRFARFVGTTKTEFLDNRQFNGHIFDLLQYGERFMREASPIAGRIVATKLERQDSPAYPPVALREALANAVCHRDYSLGGGSIAIAIFDDRLEVTSSGTLHFGLTADKLFQPHESLPWNPLIARVLYRRGIIEQWGRGTLKIAELATTAGLPRPDIEDAGGCVTVRFRRGVYEPPTRAAQDLTERQRAILAALHGVPAGLPLRFLRGATSVSSEDWELKQDLATLKRLGLVETAGHGAGAVWYLIREG